jgi:ribosomal protein S18 acetylase RimI-like enzyme
MPDPLPVTLTFTRATAADVPTLQALAKRIWHEYYPALITVGQIEYMLERFFAAPTLAHEIAEGAIWELAKMEGQVVGFLACIHEPECSRLKLSKLYLLPALHGRGFGQQLLNEVRTLARELRTLEIYLTVNKQNVRAIDAYKRAGFSIVESIRVDIGSDYVMDDYVMSYVFPTSIHD